MISSDAFEVDVCDGCGLLGYSGWYVTSLLVISHTLMLHQADVLCTTYYTPAHMRVNFHTYMYIDITNIVVCNNAVMLCLIKFYGFINLFNPLINFYQVLNVRMLQFIYQMLFTTEI